MATLLALRGSPSKARRFGSERGVFGETLWFSVEAALRFHAGGMVFLTAQLAGNVLAGGADFEKECREF